MAGELPWGCATPAFAFRVAKVWAVGAGGTTLLGEMLAGGRRGYSAGSITVALAARRSIPALDGCSEPAHR